MESSVGVYPGNVKNADNAYILALAANALASWDAKDDSTLEVLQALEKQQKELPEMKAVASRPTASR